MLETGCVRDISYRYTVLATLQCDELTERLQTWDKERGAWSASVVLNVSYIR